MRRGLKQGRRAAGLADVVQPGRLANHRAPETQSLGMYSRLQRTLLAMSAFWLNQTDPSIDNI